MSTAPFRNIALLGATGQLGSKILHALTASGFTVTVIQCPSSTNIAISASSSLKVDLTSSNALTTAFLNQDVVISAVPNPTLATEKIWINAAIAAGVRRIVLSEYSTNLERPLSRLLPIVSEKTKIREYVRGLAEEGRVEWTSVNGGPFLMPWVWISGWMGPDIKTRVATLHDGGSAIVCTSSLERIAEGVAVSLRDDHAEETKNEAVYVHSAVGSERGVTDVVGKIFGVEFDEREVSIDKITREAFEAVGRGDESKNGGFYIPFCFGEGYGGDFREQSWNGRLGFEEMSEEEIEDLVRGWLEGRK